VRQQRSHAVAALQRDQLRPDAQILREEVRDVDVVALELATLARRAERWEVVRDADPDDAPGGDRVDGLLVLDDLAHGRPGRRGAARGLLRPRLEPSAREPDQRSQNQCTGRLRVGLRPHA
jgi:hypothetical protein